MGNTVYHIVLFFLLVTNFLFPSCKEENPCSNFQTPEDFANCPSLCNSLSGSSSDASIPCYLEIPHHPSGVWSLEHETFIDLVPEQRTPLGQLMLGYWRLGETGRGLVEILKLPFFIGAPRYELRRQTMLYYPEPSNIFPPQLRSSHQSPIPYSSFLSLYFRYYLAYSTCVVELASVMTWKMQNSDDYIFADYERSTLVTGTDETCERFPDFKDLAYGFAWKTRGQIYRDENWVINNKLPIPVFTSDNPACSVDNWCNVYCLIDYDCPCHRDDNCDIFTCPGDLDCGCGQDFVCNKSCEKDEDCKCISDGKCESICGKSDPDCNCEPDGICNCDCLRDDLDCGCSNDGICNFKCGWLDIDCQCTSDGLCNMACNNGDPDCF